MQYELDKEQIKELSGQLVELLNKWMKKAKNMYISPIFDAIRIGEFADKHICVNLPYVQYTLDGERVISYFLFFIFNDYELTIMSSAFLDIMSSTFKSKNKAVLKLYFKFMKSQFGDEYIEFIKNYYTQDKINKLKGEYQKYRKEEKKIIDSYKDVESIISEVNK